MSGIAVNTYHRSHVDDAAATLAHHDGHTGMDEVKGRLQIDGNHGIPLLLGHAQHQSVLGDAGVVHQNINGAKLFLDGLHHFLGLREVGSVGGIALSLDALGSNLFLGLFVNFEVGERNVGSLLGKFQRDSFSDTACCTSNQYSLSF